MRILLLIPIYNEEKRLNLDLLKDFHSSCDLCFLDDGSTDGTSELIQKFIDTHSKATILKSARNQGKGNILNWGYNLLKSTGKLQKYDYIGYWDADLSVPFENLQEMLKFLRQNKNVSALFGSRRITNVTVVQHNFFRRFLSAGYSYFSKLILGHPLKDSKCGAKIFTREAASIAFGGMFINSWIFDLEIFFRLKQAGLMVDEFPLLRWNYMRGSKLTFSDIFIAFMGLFQLKIRYKKKDKNFLRPTNSQTLLP